MIKHQINRLVLYLLCTGFLITSCHLLDEPEEVTLQNEVEEYIISLSQELTPGDNPLIFQIETARPPLCKESEILFGSRWTAGTLKLLVDNPGLPESCLPTSVPLYSELSVETAIEDYPLEIILESTIVNRGDLLVTPESFRVLLEDPQGIILTSSQIMRIPDDIFWGSVQVSEPQNAQLLDSVIGSLESIFNVPHLIFGDYGYFQIGSQGNLWLARDNNPLTDKIFLLENNLHPEAIRNVLTDIQEEYPGISFEVMTGTGEVIKL